MKKKKIAIIIDHPSRELDYLLIIAIEIIKKSDLEIYLVQSYQKKLIYLINPNMIIAPHARGDMLSLLKNCKKNNIQIYILETEGGVISKFNVNFYKPILASLKFSDGYFSWGKKMFNYLKKSKYENKIFLTGTPKTDLLNRKLNKFYEAKKTYITFVSNFQLVNTFFSTFQKNLDEMPLKNNKIKKYYASNINEIHKKFINLIKITLNKFKKQKFILKIHPFENPELYKKILNFKNLKILHKENIYELIKKSKNLIHYNCQTSMEYYLTDSKPISYSFYLNKEEKKISNSELEKISYKPKNLKEFFNQIKKKNKINHNKKITDLFFYSQKELSSTKIADILIKKISNKSQPFSKIFFIKKWGLKKFFYFYISNILDTQTKKFIKQILNKRDYSLKNMKINLVKKKLNKLNNILNTRKNITVHKFNYLNLIYVECVIRLNSN